MIWFCSLQRFPQPAKNLKGTGAGPSGIQLSLSVRIPPWPSAAVPQPCAPPRGSPANAQHGACTPRAQRKWSSPRSHAAPPAHRGCCRCAGVGLPRHRDVVHRLRNGAGGVRSLAAAPVDATGVGEGDRRIQRCACARWDHLTLHITHHAHLVWKAVRKPRTMSTHCTLWNSRARAQAWGQAGIRLESKRAACCSPGIPNLCSDFI